MCVLYWFIHCLWAHVHACVEVREQILGIGFLLPDEGPRDWTRVVRNGDKCFLGWAISWPLVVFPHIHTDLSSFASVSLVAPRPRFYLHGLLLLSAGCTYIESMYCLFMARGQARVSWYGDLQFLPFSCRRHNCILLCDWAIFHCVSSTIIFSSRYQHLHFYIPKTLSSIWPNGLMYKHIDYYNYSFRVLSETNMQLSKTVVRDKEVNHLTFRAVIWEVSVMYY